eukprot:TRINITY_DN1383_c0_g1_i3.p1 TRINITY_DN1383_c0_g1~~TRINITY_DN1383_c0_g1_i3.p1  ORF type:complete len:830 (+),score=160.28 TRINITY_DN1383_c0_g1_i3:408-2897(+)
MIQMQRDDILRETEELKLATTMKVAEFRDIRGLKEAENQRLQQAEAIRVNNEILRIRNEMGNGTSDFQKYKAEKMAEMTRMDAEIKYIHSNISAISEEFSLLSNDLAYLKKIDLDLDKKINEQAYKGKKTVTSATAREEYGPKKPQIEYPPLPAAKWMSEVCSEPGLPSASRAAIAAAAAAEPETTFVELLCMNDMKVLRGIVLASTPQDPDVIARGIVSLFQFYGLDNELLEKVVQWEIESATDAASVFRTPTLCSKILSAYCKTVGHIYCREVIRPFVLSLVQQGRTLELDPQKIKPTEKVDDNLRALRDCAQAMLVDITNSAAKLPMQIRNICLMVKMEASKKWPSDVHVAMAGFIFIRFICEAVAYAKVFDPEIPDLPDVTLRALAQVARALFAVANGSHFKESYMVGLNQLIANNIAQTRKFYIEIAKPADSGPWARISFETLPQAVADLTAGFAALPPNQLQKAEIKINDFDKDRLYVRKFSYSPGKQLQLLMKAFDSVAVAGLPEPNAFVNELLEFVLDDDKTFVNATTAVCFSGKEQQTLSSVGKSIATLSIFADNTCVKCEDALKAVLRKEFATVASSSPDSKRRLLSSFGSQCYRQVFRIIGQTYLTSILSPLIETIRKGKSGLSKLNKKGMQFITVFLDDLQKSLGMVPLPLWKVCNWMSRQVVDMTAAFFLGLFLAPALDEIENFGSRLENKEKDKLSRKVGLIALVLRKMAFGEQFQKGDVKEGNVVDINNWLKPQADLIMHKIEAWASSDVSSAAAFKSDVVWDDSRNALVAFLNFIRAEHDSFDMILSKQTDQRCTFKLGNLYFATATLGKGKK